MRYFVRYHAVREDEHGSSACTVDNPTRESSSIMSPTDEQNMLCLIHVIDALCFCFGSLVILDVARCYLWLFTLYINI